MRRIEREKVNEQRCSRDRWPSTAPDKAPHDEESAPHTSSRDDLIHKEFGEAKRD